MITQYLAKKLQENLFGKRAYTIPSTYYLGLSTTAITYTGTGKTEPSGNGYARVAIANNTTNWSTATTASTSEVIKNNVKVSFPESTGDWGICTHVFLADAATGGNILFAQELNVARDIKVYSQLFFDIGGLEFTLSNE